MDEEEDIEVRREILDCARYGDLDDLKELFRYVREKVTDDDEVRSFFNAVDTQRSTG